MKIPNDLEQYSQRLIDFCDSLSASAYVNFHRLFLMRVVKSNPNSDQQPIIDYYLKVADESERLEPKLQDFHITTYKPFVFY